MSSDRPQGSQVYDLAIVGAVALGASSREDVQRRINPRYDEYHDVEEALDRAFAGKVRGLDVILHADGSAPRLSLLSADRAESQARQFAAVWGSINRDDREF